MKELGEPKDEYDVKTIIKTMIDIDINSFKDKIKDSFKYFDENNEEAICTYFTFTFNKIQKFRIIHIYIVRVLKRSLSQKEASIRDAVNQFKNANGNISYEGLMQILDKLKTK